MSLAKIFAREWIYLLFGVVVGLVISPIIWVSFIEPHIKIGDYYEALIYDSDWLLVWLFVLVPYALFQLARITSWALREIRK